MDRRRYLQALGGAGAVVSLAGCLGRGQSPRSPGASGEGLTLAAGTTTHDSGLLDALHPGFEQRFAGDIDVVVRGTGGALRTARNGDCDVVLVHARSLENTFLRNGYGINRRTVMENDFMIVGPPTDPADIASLGPVGAFRAIAKARASFLSRGDRSGTHIRERIIWNKAGIEPAGEWYRETGQGMGQTLVIASQADAYTLTDRGSFLNIIDSHELIPLLDRGLSHPPPLLRNEYAVIPVNPAHHRVSYGLAMAYVGYVTGPAQSRIAEFAVNDMRAFRPTALTEHPDFHQYVPSDWDS